MSNNGNRFFLHHIDCTCYSAEKLPQDCKLVERGTEHLDTDLFLSKSKRLISPRTCQSLISYCLFCFAALEVVFDGMEIMKRERLKKRE